MASQKAPDRRSQGSIDAAAVNRDAFSYYRRLRQVESFVDQHYMEPISRDQVAEVAHLEPKYFSIFFHEKIGLCFRDWLTLVRITKARSLLEQRNYSMRRVAHTVGYRDIGTFERAFKRCTGMTPSAFKKSVRPS